MGRIVNFIATTFNLNLRDLEFLETFENDISHIELPVLEVYARRCKSAEAKTEARTMTAG
jgi:hypothetical protein